MATQGQLFGVEERPPETPRPPKRQGVPGYECRLVVTLPRVSEAAGPRMKTGRDFYELCQDLRDLPQESFHVVTMNQKNAVIARHMVSLGSLTYSLVHPREVFRPALLDNAAAVAFVHNHPSGDPKPSKDDIELTARLKDCATLLGIRILDHVVVGREAFFSFVEEGII